MPFPTVKSSPYGLPLKRREDLHLWSEAKWKKIVYESLLTVSLEIRIEIIPWISYKYTGNQLKRLKSDDHSLRLVFSRTN